MKPTPTLLSAFSIFFALSLQAATYYVDASRPDDAGAGTSWASAKQTIQAAVDASVAGDTVLVTNGVYNTGVTSIPGVGSNNRVVICKQITVRSVNGASSTFIDGSGAVGAVPAVDTRCVYMDNNSKLEGFTVQHGVASEGGGIYVFPGEVRNCVIRYCRATMGGGTELGTFYNCIIAFNSASNGGGGSCYSTLYSCLVYGNSANFAGGSYCGHLNNCTITGNTATGYESGGTRFCTINNSIVWGNTARGKVANYYKDTFTYSCTAPLAEGVGNISYDPLFLVTGDEGDYRLQASSPCINSGMNAYATGTTDLLGNPRIQCDTVDMGACESALRGPVSPPVFTPPSGAVFDTSLPVAITCGTEGATIRYTLNGSEPDVDSTLYTNALTLTHSSSFRAKAFKAGMADSLTVAAHFSLKGENYFVDASRPDDSGDGFSWETAKKTIQAAITVSSNGDTVLVTNGVYNTGSATVPYVSLKNRVYLDKAITVRSVNGASSTFIEGSGSTFFGTPSALRCVYIENNATLEGFTVRYGETYSLSQASSYPSLCGGGIFALEGVVKDCVIQDCNAVLGGGVAGMVAGGGEAVGGTFYNCIITHNRASNGGGGTYAGTLCSCLVYGNSASFAGGAYYGNLNNCTITGNSASGIGAGGISYTTIKNSIVWMNTARGESSNYYKDTITYSCSDPLPDGAGNIAYDPLFVASSEGDYQVQGQSLCVNGGNNTDATGAADLLGNPRIQCGIVDMGAYESNGAGPVRPPVFTPPSGACISNTLIVAITCGREGATIHYTLDGSEPTDSSVTYTNPIVLSSTTTIRARAFADGMEPGRMTTATYKRLYNLSVANGTVGGTISGFYEAGTNLTLAADPPPAGKVFGWWSATPTDADLGDAFDPALTNITLSMPARLLALAAVYVPNPGATSGSADVRLVDAATGLPLDVAQWSLNGRAWYPQGPCPVKPARYAFRFRSTDLRWLAPDDQNILVTSESVVTVTGAFTRVPVVSWAAEGNGTVALSPATGQVLPGKNVSLTAEPAKGQVFVQWTDGERSRARTVAPDADTLYTAVFTSKGDPDYLKQPPSVTFAGAASGMVGVTFAFAQATAAPLPAQFSAAGLPPGLSIDRATGIISGKPTKSGTYAATVTATGPAGGKGEASRTFAIGPLPLGARGTFSGVLFGGGNAVQGTLALTVSERGAISAKIASQTSTNAFTAASWDAESDGVFTVALRAPKGESLALTLDTGLGDWGLALEGGVSGGTFGDRLFAIRGQRNVFRDEIAKNDDAARVLSAYKGYYTAALPVEDAPETGAAANRPQGSGFVTFTIKDGGLVTLSGKAADGTTLSGSTTLIVCDADTPDERAYVPLFFPLYNTGGRLAGLLAVERGEDPSPTDNTVALVSGESAPIGWTYPGKAPNANPPQTEDRFALELGASGGFYDKLVNLAAYYANGGFVAQTPTVPYVYTCGAYSTVAGVTETALPAVALRFNPATGAVALPIGDAPSLDARAGAYAFDPANTAMTTLAFKKTVGLFSGQFTLYYEYRDAAGKPKLHSVCVAHRGVLTPVRRNPEASPAGQGSYEVPDTWTSPVAPSVNYRISRSFLIELRP